MSYAKRVVFLILLNYSASIILYKYCDTNPSAIQCTTLQSLKSKVSLCDSSNANKLCRYLDSSETKLCDPYSEKGCLMNEVIDPKIASCRLEITRNYGLKQGYKINPDLRCTPSVLSYINIYTTRISGGVTGVAQCVAEVYGKKLVCGEKGTRCICEPSSLDRNRQTATGVQNGFFFDRTSKNGCRCEWFVDMCDIIDMCSAETSQCVTSNSYVQCKGGSVNQCHGNPRLCEEYNSYCVELDDRDTKWQLKNEIEGEGYACISKDSFDNMIGVAKYCNFNVTDHKVTGGGVRRPEKGLETCCYQHLVCANNNKGLGGYLFRERPCYCNTEFKKCLMKQQDNVQYRSIANNIITILDFIKYCQMDDSGKCDPLKPGSCTKGDLIDPSIAHCRINCKTGPLLPIQLRACRTRQCTPIHALPHKRNIDITHFTESSRCDAVPKLPVSCGEHHTRCACDSQPTVDYFTDKCRCQYWPN